MPADPEPQNLPIFKLNPPILWEIFSINAPWERSMIYTFESHPLTIVRRASQVCRVWRQVLLESPSLWGRCFDLDMLTTEVDDRWRDLVLQRSGQSPLAVVMHRQNARPGEHLMEYFVKLLNDHWTRIGKVDLTLWYNDKRMWETFARPSASLMYFSVTMFTPPYDLIFPENCQLFAKYAPCLIRFSLPSQQFQSRSSLQSQSSLPQSLMLSSARHMQMSKGQAPSGIDLLAALQGMPLLEVLEMDITRSRVDNRVSEKISMPNLKSISIWSSSLNAFPAFLEQIIHPPECEVYLTYNLLLIDRPSPELTRDHAQRAVKRFLGGSTANHREVELIMQDDEFISSLDRRLFRLRVEAHLIEDGGVIFTGLVDTMTTFECIHAVSQLKLDLFPGRSARPPFECFPNLYTLFQSLPSVTTLIATPKSMRVLVEIPQLDILFPSLTTLAVHSIYAGAGPRDIVDQIKPFLEHRHNMTVPVSTLDLANCSFPGDYRALDKLAGLKVVWNNLLKGAETTAAEYMCGSGNVEKLLVNLTNKYDVVSSDN